MGWALASLPFFGPDVAGAFALAASSCAYLFPAAARTEAGLQRRHGRVLTASGQRPADASGGAAGARRTARARGAQLSLSLIPGAIWRRRPPDHPGRRRGCCEADACAVQELTSNEDAQVPIELARCNRLSRHDGEGAQGRRPIERGEGGHGRSQCSAGRRRPPRS